MDQSDRFNFDSLANNLRELIKVKCHPNSCIVTNNDSRITIRGGICRMIPHTAIVVIYRFAIVHNMLMFFDTDNGHFVLH